MIKLIQTAADHQEALQRISSLMDKKPPVGSAKSDELLVLAKLVEFYEKEQHDIGLPDAISAIRFRMDQQGLTNAEMVSYLGTPSRVSEVLNGKRPLTMVMIRNLHLGLGLPLEPLVLGSTAPKLRPSAKKADTSAKKPKLSRVVRQRRVTSRLATSA